MKKYVLAVLVVLGLVASVNADRYVAGDFNGWNSSGNLMTDNLDGTFSVSLTGIGAGRHEFKITDGSWGWTHPGPNSWLYADGAGNVTVTFNSNTVSDGWDPTGNRIGLSTDASSWNVVGGFQSWNNADSAWTMTSLGGGQHMLSKFIAAGTYDYKYVVTGSWDSISWDNRSVNTANTQIVLAADSTVNFYVDNLLGRVKAEIVPEPATMALFGLGSLFLARRKK